MQVWLPDSERFRLASMAKKTGCTKSQLVREAIVLMLDQAEDRARARAALVDTGLSFEQFTQTAKIVIGRAEDEAFKLGFNTVGSEHLLLALCTDSLTGNILVRAGIMYGGIKNKITVLKGLGDDSIFGAIQFAPDAQQSLKRARRIAKEAHDPSIDSHHILLALIQEFKGGAFDVLEMLGIDRDQLQEAVMKVKPQVRKAIKRRRRT